jgi:phenylalanine-4-hydroxylase
MLSTIQFYANLAKDLILPASPKELLSGKRFFRPFMHYQKSWASWFYPNDIIDHKGKAWFYLQKYMMPLINKHASLFHIEGIRRLKLDNLEKPDFYEFQKMFTLESNGFSLQIVEDEIEPLKYFEMIRDKKFPCVQKLRSLNRLFCGSGPDFWHEAIGHIAPLCFSEVQELYLTVADYMLAAKSKDEFQQRLAIAWTLTEYGFIKENDKHKMFGAALVGSHLCHMRYLHGMIQIETAQRESIITSGFYSETETPQLARNVDGKLRFFCMDNFNIGNLFL